MQLKRETARFHALRQCYCMYSSCFVSVCRTQGIWRVQFSLRRAHQCIEYGV
jgi:hypothetical protein